MDRVGLGCAPIGNLYTALSEAEAAATLMAAVAAGVRAMDTAPLYGYGLSESRLGAFLRAPPLDRVSVSTKVGRRLVQSNGESRVADGFVDTPPVAAVFDYSERGVRTGFEQSLNRLGVERVDTLLLHDVGQSTHGDGHAAIIRQVLDEALPAMHAIRAEGRAGRIGLGVNEIAVVDELLPTGLIDVVLLAGRYTLMDQSAAGLFDRCRARGTAVMAAGVYNSGLLAGSDTYDYQMAPPELIARRDAIAAIAHRHDVDPIAAALAFPLAHPAVDQIVVGMRSPAEVAATAVALEAAIPPEFWQDMVDGGFLSAASVVPC